MQYTRSNLRRDQIPKFNLYELDGATFRQYKGFAGIQEILNPDTGEWQDYEGDDRMAPVTFGDFLGEQEMN